jgi:hypothetical protein
MDPSSSNSESELGSLSREGSEVEDSSGSVKSAKPSLSLGFGTPEEMLDRIRGNWPDSVSRIHVIPSGIDVGDFTRLAVSTSSSYFDWTHDTGMIYARVQDEYMDVFGRELVTRGNALTYLATITTARQLVRHHVRNSSDIIDLTLLVRLADIARSAENLVLETIDLKNDRMAPRDWIERMKTLQYDYIMWRLDWRRGGNAVWARLRDEHSESLTEGLTECAAAETSESSS